ncbi:MAG TPA: hypothetical protein VIG72_06575 [Pontibacter sp.]
MKRLHYLRYLFAALLLVTIASCSKDDDDDATPDKDLLLTDQTWTGDKLLIGGQDVTILYKDRITKTTLKFNTDGTYTFDSDGTTKTGSWEFANDQKQVIMDKNAANELTADIKRLTATELWVEGEFFDLGQDVEVRFIH